MIAITGIPITKPSMSAATKRNQNPAYGAMDTGAYEIGGAV